MFEDEFEQMDFAVETGTSKFVKNDCRHEMGQGWLFGQKSTGWFFSNEKSKFIFGREFDKTNVTTTFRTSILVRIDINHEAFGPKGKMVIWL